MKNIHQGVDPLRMRSAALATAGVLLLNACASTTPPAPASLGDSKASAIEVCMPVGQRAYIANLVCPSGQAPTFLRIGSLGSRTEAPEGADKATAAIMLDQLIKRRPLNPGEPDYHVIDKYEVSCGESSKRSLYFDMYHCDQAPPTTAPPGFTLRTPR